MITHQQMDQLLQFKNGRYLVTSCYLNLDRGQMPPQTLKIRVKDLIQSARHSLQGKIGTHEQRQSLQRDFERIEQFVQQDILGNRHKALAVFSCDGEKFWQAYTLPRVVRNVLVADHAPYIRPLTVMLAQQRRYCVVLVDRVHGQLFEIYMGEILEHKELLGDVPRWASEGGQGGREERNMERCYVEAVHQHFQRVADAAFRLFKQHQFHALVLGGHREVLLEFKEHLHAYLRERLVGEFTADPCRTSTAEVLRLTEPIEVRVAAEHEQRITADLIHKAAAGRAVSGMAATLTALSRGEAQLLLVEEGFELPGYICRSCLHLSPDAATCPQCEQSAEPCPDVVDEAVGLAAVRNCRVEHVRGATLLREAGRIGALLRY
jgi:peptide subunit release factor 1 (eRF1)